LRAGMAANGKMHLQRNYGREVVEQRYLLFLE
jgi:hypothetical protein